MDMPRRDLWAARIPGQVFVIEQHSQGISDGPGIMMTALIPDFHHFNARGGRALPYLHPDGTPNLAPGLPRALATSIGCAVTDSDVLAYIAAVVASPAYTQTFAAGLTTPGIRVPVTADPDLWAEATAFARRSSGCTPTGLPSPGHASSEAASACQQAPRARPAAARAVVARQPGRRCPP
jgi:Type ISP C-terminal specificity domain